MVMGNDLTGDTAVLCITCPSCGEVYDSAETVGGVLRNNGFCVNITCLQDLTRESLDEVARRKNKRHGD